MKVIYCAEPFTPTRVDFAEVMRALAPFGDSPVVVKDYVKSRKHEWLEACYIPSAAERGSVERVVKRFLELQGEEVEKAGPDEFYRALRARVEGA
ncbi:MAG TPA: ATP-grasp domain-containing protein [Pyrinomonadaceae bacterium]|nr:ATP-grasp domain-containing protein [Pyrinomonadaceae bacterium]